MPIYINLTQGLEHPLANILTDKRYIRIQSTHLEQGRIDLVAKSLSDDFLVNLAMGEECYIMDCGSRRKSGCPRAIWQGLTLVNEWASRYWKSCPIHWIDKYNTIHGLGQYHSVARGIITSPYFECEEAKRKFTYAKKFLSPEKTIRMDFMYWSARKDSTEGQAQIIREWVERKNYAI